MSTGLSSLSMTLKTSVNGSGTESVTGADYSALKQTLAISKSVGPFTTANANNAALGADLCASFITSVAASGSADIDLTSVTDILLRTSISFARVKAYVIRLLSVADDATNGTTCSGITTNGAGTNLIVLPGITGAVIGNGECLSWATPNAAGVTVSGTTKIIHVVNNDASHAAAVQLTVVGAST